MAGPELELAAAECRQFFDEFHEALAEKLVLPAQLVKLALVGLLTRGHLLLEGKPGLGKRTLAATLAELGGLSFSAFSCTGDLTPLDLTGDEQLREAPEGGRHRYEFMPGPLFANVAYIEDLHLAPPKCLAVVVEAMRSQQLGPGRNVHDLPRPYFLVASVAPDLDDTAMALEASVTDRFAVQLSFDYPGGSDEWEIGRRAGGMAGGDRKALVSAEKLSQWQDAVARVEMPDEVLGYAWALVRASRPGNDLAPDFVEKWIRLGVSPQGLVALTSTAKARALLRGRTESSRRDVYEVSRAVFQHRLRRSEEAKAAGLTVDRLLRMLHERISLDGDYRPEGLS